MKKDYFIIGSGGFSKEVYFLSEEVLGNSFQFKGFIDYEPKSNVVTVRKKEEKVLDEDFFLKNFDPKDDISLFMGVGNPQLIHKLSERFKNFHFPNLIHPKIVGDMKSIELGRGNIITAGCIFTVDISIGSFNLFNLNTSIGHDTIIGDCNVFNPACNISGNVKIGCRNMFGVNSSVLQQLEIKNDNIIGAASLVNNPIGNQNTIVGVPGKSLKK